MHDQQHFSTPSILYNTTYIVRTGWFRQVHVKARRTMELRTLLTSRKTLVLKIGDVENQIRGSLHLFGIKLRTAKHRTFSKRVRELTADLPRVAAILDVLLRMTLLPDDRSQAFCRQTGWQLGQLAMIRDAGKAGDGPITRSVLAPGRLGGDQVLGCQRS